VKLLAAIIHPSTELLDAIADRVGLGSIASTVGITTAVESGWIEIVSAWSWPGVALVISMTGGLLFIVKLWHDIKKARLETKLIQIKIDAVSKE